jgi:transposase
MGEGVEVRLRPDDRKRLDGVVSDRKSAQCHVWRARIVVMTADGAGTMAIRAATGKGKPTIWRWQAHHMQDGADGLFRDAPRGRAFAAVSPEQLATMVERTLHEDPPAATHWTLRSMAKASGLAPSTIHRIWREHGLKPHRIETFKLYERPGVRREGPRAAGNARRAVHRQPLCEPARAVEVCS